MIVGYSRTYYSAEARQFFDRISNPGETRRNLYATMIDALVAAGVWTKLDVLYVWAAADSATALTSLISSTFNATLNGTPTFTSDLGYSNGNATNNLHTNFNPSTESSPKFVQDSATVFLWNLDTGATSSAFDWTRAGGSSVNQFLSRNASDLFLLSLNASSVDATGVAATNGSGLFGGSRVASTGYTYYRNGSSLGTRTNSSAAPENAVFRFGPVRAQVIAGFGSGLNATEMLAVYNAVHPYLQSVAGVA